MTSLAGWGKPAWVSAKYPAGVRTCYINISISPLVFPNRFVVPKINKAENPKPGTLQDDIRPRIDGEVGNLSKVGILSSFLCKRIRFQDDLRECRIHDGLQRRFGRGTSRQRNRWTSRNRLFRTATHLHRRTWWRLLECREPTKLDKKPDRSISFLWPVEWTKLKLPYAMI